MPERMQAILFRVAVVLYGLVAITGVCLEALEEAYPDRAEALFVHISKR